MTFVKRLSGMAGLIAVAVVSLKLLQVHTGLVFSVVHDHHSFAIPFNVIAFWLSIGIASVWVMHQGYAYIRRHARNK